MLSILFAAYEYYPDSEEASISVLHTTGRSELVVERSYSKEWDAGSTMPDISETALEEETEDVPAIEEETVAHATSGQDA